MHGPQVQTMHSSCGMFSLGLPHNALHWPIVYLSLCIGKGDSTGRGRSFRDSSAGGKG